MIIQENKHEYATYQHGEYSPISLTYQASLHLPLMINIEDSIFHTYFNVSSEPWPPRRPVIGDKVETSCSLEFWLAYRCHISQTLEREFGAELGCHYHFGDSE